MKTKLIVILLFFHATLMAETCEQEIRSLEWVENANPETDVLAAIKIGDTRLMAVYGFTLMIPGVERQSRLAAHSKENHRAIEGTTDAFCSERHAELNELAWEYAKKYNQKLLGAVNGS